MRDWLHRHKRQFRFLKPAWRAWRRLARTIPPVSWLGASQPGRPGGIHYTVDDYLAAHPKAGNIKIILPAQNFTRPLPRTLEDLPPHPVFAALTEARVPAQRTFELFGARYWGHYGGTLIGQDNRLLAEISPDIWSMEGHSALARWRFPACRRLNGTVAVISTGECDNNYWHWTFDLLPRVWYLQQAGFTAANVDWWVVNHRDHPYQWQTLERLGIARDKVIRADDQLHFTADRVVTATMPPTAAPVLPQVARWLREDFGKVTALPRRRFYLTRKNCTWRRLLNEAEIEPMLREHGFEFIEPGSLDLAGQMALFAEAQIIAGPHGSAFTNAIYASPSATLLEIMPTSYVDGDFWSQAMASGQSHFVEFGPGASGLDYTAICRQDDLRVDPARFARILEIVAKQTASSSPGN